MHLMNNFAANAHLDTSSTESESGGRETKSRS